MNKKKKSIWGRRLTAGVWLGSSCHKSVLIGYNLQRLNWFYLLGHRVAIENIPSAGWYFLMLNRPLVSQTASALTRHKRAPTTLFFAEIKRCHMSPQDTVYLKPSHQEETLKVRPLSEANSHRVTGFFCHWKCLMIIPARLRSLRFWLYTFCVCVCESWCEG